MYRKSRRCAAKHWEIRTVAVAEKKDIDLYALYDEHYPRVRSFIRAKVKDAWVADDLTQETFVRAFRHITGLKQDEKIRSWLFQIANHLCLDYFRSLNSRRSGDKKLKVNLGSAGPPLLERKVEQKEMSSCVRDHMQYLREDYRNVIFLFEIMGLSQKEIAESLGLSKENVKVQIHRARRALKSILEAHCVFDKDERDVLVCEPRFNETI
jgi:RNA polymerase sigma-70 factor (ECF subfamily)